MRLKALMLVLLSVLCIGLVSCVEGNEGIPTDSSNENGHVHTYVDTVVPPTCTAEGYTTRECECGVSGRVDIVPKLEHTKGLSTVVISATCSQEGKEEARCTVCNEVLESKTIEKSPHVYAKTIVAPTCTEYGYTQSKCVDCGHSYSDEYKDALGCISATPIVTKNATCKQTGTREFRCKNCDKLIKQETISVTSCDYVSYSVPQNGTVEAHTLYVCSSCGGSYKGPYISSDALEQTTAKEIYNNSKDAIVEIVSYDKSGKSMSVGSGFFISADGYIATNYHVIKAAYGLAIYKYSDSTEVKDVKVVAYDEAEDVAILKIEATDEKYLEFSTTSVEIGDSVYVIGSSLGLTGTYTYGMVSTVDRYVNGTRCIQFTAPISGGNSGGPLLDSKGKVIGIVTFTIPDAQNINFAIKSATVEGVNAQKLATPLDLPTLYEQQLESNAIHIIKYYIMNNHSACEDDLYYLFEYEPATATSYAREYYYIYDSSEDAVFLQIDVLVNGMSRISISIELDDDKDGMFGINMYDYEYSQSTIFGYLDHTAELKIMPPVYNDAYFKAVFSNVESKYVDDPSTPDKNEPQNMNHMLYQSYSSLIGKFANMLAKSETGVTIETIDLSPPTY